MFKFFKQADLNSINLRPVLSRLFTYAKVASRRKYNVGRPTLT